MNVRQQLEDFFRELGFTTYDVQVEIKDPKSDGLLVRSLSFFDPKEIQSGVIKCQTAHLVFYFAFDGKNVVSVQPQMRYDVLKVLATKREPSPMTIEQPFSSQCSQS